MANNQASDIVESAINEALKLMDGHDDGDILVEWITICYVVNPNKKNGEAYPTLMSNGEMPTHHARGLLKQGQTIMSIGWLSDQIDEDEE